VKSFGMANMKKYFVPNLSELVKNKEKFAELDKKVQSQILSFLADNKIIAQNNRLVKKATKEIKEAINQIVSNNIDKLQDDIDSLEPKDRIKAIFDLLVYSDTRRIAASTKYFCF
jgi:hypothetical protein